MARIRTVKPEFWEDETIAALSRDARLLFIATFNFADDEGILRWSPEYIKANAFMYDDDVTVPITEALMGELAESDLVFSYRGGKPRRPLAYIVNFRKHQKINRPQDGKLPPPSIQDGAALKMYIRRDKGVCHLCGGEISTDHDERRAWPSLDHVVPRSKGGSDYPSNLLLAHSSCNISRRDRDPESFKGSPLTRSVKPSVNGSLSDSSPEGNGREGDTERKTPTVPAPAQAGETVEQRTNRLAKTYTDRVKLSNFPAVRGVVRKAVRADYDDPSILGALGRMADDGRSVTTDTLRHELEGFTPNGRSATAASSKAEQWTRLGAELASAEEPRAIGGSL